MTLLTLNDVSKSFGPVRAVDGASFSVDRGQVVGFLGPNGAGKSTTMRIINQLFEPDSGYILFDGEPLPEVSRDAKRRIGYLAENNPLYGEMLTSEYLGFVADLREIAGTERQGAIDDAVAATGIAEVFYRQIGNLSKGYKQRVGLAQAILHRPDLLILDEPTEGLDPNQRIEIRRLIADLGRDHTVVLSTHVLPEVQHTCTRLLIIHEGRIAADGPVDELVAQASGAVRIAVGIKGAGAAEAIRGIEGVRQVDDSLDEVDGLKLLTVTADSSTDVRPGIFDLAKARDWTLYELHQETRSLEDLFRELTSGTGSV